MAQHHLEYFSPAANRMHSGTVLSVGHLCFGSTQSTTHNHGNYACKMKENRLET